MESYYLQIEVKKTQDEILNGQPESITMEFDSEQEVRDAAKGIVNFLYLNREVEAFLIINRHSSDGNLPCTKYSINLETLELTEL